MRLLTITGKHPQQIARIYQRHPELRNQSYASQHEALVADSFAGAEIWSAGLVELGYETERVYANAEAAQTQWAVENGLGYDNGWMRQISAAQVKAYRPDILFVTLNAVDACFLRQLKEENNSLRLVIGWCGIPFAEHVETLHECDTVLSNVPELVADLRAHGLRAHHLNHAFDPRVLDYLDLAREPRLDFSFIGSINVRPGFHVERHALLRQLVRRTDVQIWSGVTRPTRRQFWRLRAKQVAFDIARIAERLGASSVLESLPKLHQATNWTERPDNGDPIDSQVANRAQPPVFGLDMFEKLRDSRVVLNTHIDASKSASNMRLYETTGVATCLLTDWKDNLPELFEPDTEVVTYRSVEECVERIDYLLTHESQRRAIAAAGQKRTLARHTIYRRAEQLDAILQSDLR